MLLTWGGLAQGAVAEVRDEAHFFSAQAVTKANETVKEIKQRHKKDLLIETVRHVPENKKDEATSSDGKVKTRFFANWAVERARMEGVNGIYVLITREPGHVEVVVGNQTQAVFSNEERHHLSQLLLKHLRQKEYDEGLLAAVNHVRAVLGSAPSAGAPVAAPSTHSQLPNHRAPAPDGRLGSAGGSWMRWLGIGLAALLALWLVSAVLRAISGNQTRPVTAGFGGSGGTGGPGPYGSPGGYGGYGGGGLFPSLMGGLFGAAAGSWLYDQFSGGHSRVGGYGHMDSSPTSGATPDARDTDYTAEGGDFNQQAEVERDDQVSDGSPWSSDNGDFGGDDGGGFGGDFGGGGDVGGGDTSGGDF
jgi:uncharacterized protein